MRFAPLTVLKSASLRKTADPNPRTVPVYPASKKRSHPVIRLAIAGAGGRMGRRLLALSDADPAFTLTQAIEWPEFPLLGRPLNAEAPLAPRAEGIKWTDAFTAEADVLVDFSSPASTVANAKAAAWFGVPLVAGATGLTEEEEEEVRAVSKTIPVMHAPNYSLGVNLMFKLAAEAARVLGEDYDIEIVESHHNRKVDAPSGTALGIAKAVAEPLGRDLKKDVVHGRSGAPGKRPKGEIGIHAIRMGAVGGDHTVYFCNDYECFSLTHHIESRDVLASGALRAAKWIVGREPGYYTMADMLFG